jgi:hypothetical protein
MTPSPVIRHRTSNTTRHKSRHSRLITQSIPAVIQKFKCSQMPIHPNIRPRLLTLKYKSPNFISLDSIHVESLVWIPVISHLEINVTRKNTVDAADAVEVVELDALWMENG